MVESGTIVDERYRVVARLGTGGMADVYLAQDTLLGRQVALKLLHHRFAEDQEFVERFRREASSAAGLSHPNVVAVFDRGQWDGTYYIAMEYLPGRSLKAVVREHGMLAPPDAIDIVVQILLALRFSHRRGIIHRDIKPHNVILDEEGRAKVTDFGIARAGASDMTMTGSIMGTAQYLSPEQAQGHAVGEASDLYSVGVVLYELLTGSVPFEGESAVTIALKQVSAQPTPPSARNPEVGEALDAVVMRALAKEPSARFASADEFIAALQQARAGIMPATAPAAGNGAPATAATALAPLPVAAAAAGGAALTDPVAEDAALADAQAWTRRRRRRVWTAMALAALALGAAVLLLLLPAGSGTVTVPDVTGETQTAAVATLKHEGLAPAVTLTPNARVASGLVIGTTPPRGTVVKKQTRVLVYVSTGAESVAVPNVVGKSGDAATSILKKKGLVPKPQSQASETVAKGIVIATDPTDGVSVQAGSPVTVFVSSGPQEATVPNVTGESQEGATAALTGAGLKAKVQKRETPQPAAGAVISQTPAAGSHVKAGTVVTIVVAQAPSKTPVPSVLGQSEVQAIGALSAAGFAAKTVTREVSDTTKVGIVLQQSPEAGHKLAKDATVTIAVGKLAQQTTSTSTTPAPTPPAAAPSGPPPTPSA